MICFVSRESGQALGCPNTVNGTVPRRRLLNAKRRPREYLTFKEVGKLVEGARSRWRYGHRDATMILIAYRHGLRASELRALRWDQVDLERGLVHVRRLKSGTPSVHPLGGVEIRARGLGLWIMGTGYELRNFAMRQKAPDFLGQNCPRRPTAPTHCVAAVGFRAGACDAALAPRPLRKIVADKFFPIIGIRAMLNRERVRQGIVGPLVAAETTQKFGENAIPGRLTYNPLISLEMAKEKVWRSLEKFGKAWNFLGISFEKFGNP
jgi:hypothetical protein